MNERFNETDKKIDTKFRKVNQKFSKLEKNLGLNTEYKAITYFNDNIKNKEKIANQYFDYYIANEEIKNKNKILAEIDLILINGKKLGIVETKTTLNLANIIKFFNKTLVEFKKLNEINSSKNQKKIIIKNKPCIAIFACSFINKLDEIKEYRINEKKEFYIYKENNNIFNLI